MKMKLAAEQFLTGHRIAVTGVSRSPKDHGGNVVYRRLRERGYDVVAVNPCAEVVEGDPCYPDLASVPGHLDGVVIATRPERAEATMRECADLGVRSVWMHRGIGQGGVSDAATQFGRVHGMTVIDGGCPCMFGPTADRGHRVLRAMLTPTSAVPRRV